MVSLDRPCLVSLPWLNWGMQEQARGPAVPEFNQVVKERKYRWGLGDTVTWPDKDQYMPSWINQLSPLGRSKWGGGSIGRSPLLKVACRRHFQFPMSQSLGSALIPATAVVDVSAWAQPPCWQHYNWNKPRLKLFALESCLKPQEAAQPSSKW